MLEVEEEEEEEEEERGAAHHHHSRLVATAWVMACRISLEERTLPFWATSRHRLRFEDFCKPPSEAQRSNFAP